MSSRALAARRRIWSEMVPLAELAQPRVLEPLAARGVQLLVAAQPGQGGPLVQVLKAAARLELSVGLWPMLPDADGRWLNHVNASPFVAWAEALLEDARRRGARVDTLALDLEPPIDRVRQLVASPGLGAVARGAAAHLVRQLRSAPGGPRRPVEGGCRATRGGRPSLVERLRAPPSRRSVELLGAVLPPVVAPGRAGAGWSRLVGAPVEEDELDAIGPMAYTTLFEGYSRGVVRRADARALLHASARLTVRRFGGRAAISLGAVGPGALGDERTYRDPSELADDVAIARAAGVEDIALFDLSGVLARPPIERWLDALIGTSPAAEPPAITARARAIGGAVALAGAALSWRSDPRRAAH